MYGIGGDYYEEKTVEFKREYISRKLKDESVRPLLDDLYRLTRGIIVHNRGLSLLNRRLKTFLGESLNKVVSDKKRSQKPLIYVKDAKWEDVILRFVDEEEVEINVKGKNFGAKKFYDLGFQDRRNRNTNKPIPLWKYLITIAILKELNPREKKLPVETTKKPLKKIASELRGKLKEIFGIPDDPFYDYNEKNAWVPKFHISMKHNVAEQEKKPSEYIEDFNKEQEKYSERYSDSIKIETIKSMQKKKEE